MKYLLIFLLSVAGLQLVAQDDCYYEVDEFDEFTKERKTISHLERIAVQVDGNVHFQACYVNKDYFLRVKLALNESWIVPKGNQVWIMLGDDNILKVNAMEEGDGMDSEGQTSSYEDTFDLDVTEDQWELIKANKITRMRFVLDEGHYDFKIKDAKSDELQQLMECVEKE